MIDKNLNIKLNNNTPSGAGGICFLVGMMGSGKSYWAQQLAAANNVDWMDLDAEIEKENRLSVREIFEIKGETFFREKEKQALHNLAAHQNIIIATGGGTPCFHNNMQWMNQQGITIWIDESITVLASRLQKEKAHRPLIKHLNDDELATFLENKLTERKTYYEQSKFILQGSDISLQKLQQILTLQ